MQPTPRPPSPTEESIAAARLAAATHSPLAGEHVENVVDALDAAARREDAAQQRASQHASSAEDWENEARRLIAELDAARARIAELEAQVPASFLTFLARGREERIALAAGVIARNDVTEGAWELASEIVAALDALPPARKDADR